VQDRFTTLFYSIEEEKDRTQVVKLIGKIENTMTRKVLLSNNGMFFVRNRPRKVTLALVILTKMQTGAILQSKSLEITSKHT
jgi:hypothetical protein